MCNLEKGTTTFAFIFNEGVMVAADHPFSSKKLVGNVVDLSTHMFATISGGCEDCRTFLIDLQKQYHRYARERKVSVEEASKWMAGYLSSCVEKASSIKVLIAGWNESVPELYYVDCKGEPRRGTEFHIGSGSCYAECALFRKNCQDISFDEAENLAKDALLMVTSELLTNIEHDEGGEIGGFISAYCVGVDGWKPVFLNEEGGEAETSDEEEYDFFVCEGSESELSVVLSRNWARCEWIPIPLDLLYVVVGLFISVEVEMSICICNKQDSSFNVPEVKSK